MLKLYGKEAVEFAQNMQSTLFVEESNHELREVDPRSKEVEALLSDNPTSLVLFVNTFPNVDDV